MFGRLLLDLIIRHPHLYAQLLDFAAPRHHATVVVGQDHDGPVGEIGAEHPFTTHEAVIAVTYGIVHRMEGFNGWWRLQIFPLLYGPHYHAPHLEVVTVENLYRFERGIGRVQDYDSKVALAQIEVFYGEFVIDVCHHDVAV